MKLHLASSVPPENADNTWMMEVGVELLGDSGHRCVGTWSARSVLVAAFAVTALMGGPSHACASGGEAQTDWSGGAQAGSTVSWDGEFAVSEGVSWLAVGGQITLAGVVLDPPVRHTVADDFFRPSSLDLVDLDGDLDLDLVGAAFGANRIRLWLNDGGDPPVWHTEWTSASVPAASSVRARDFDGDGTVDVAGCGWDSGEVAVWYRSGPGEPLEKQTVATGFSQCHWVDAADLDGDGDLDLLGAAAEASEVRVWINDGARPPTWDPQIVEENYGGARSVVPSDLDNDGDVDLIGTGLTDDDVSWWRNDGGAPLVWTRIVLSDQLSGAHHADAWDLDLDGDLDVVAAGFSNIWLVLFRNDGGDPPGWSEESFGGMIRGALVVDVADLDGDGDLDVVGTSNNWDRVMWWHNNGSAPETWSATTIVSDFVNAWPVVVGDVDGNGALDVVSGASGALEVAWWRLTDFVSNGSLTSRPLQIPENVMGLSCSIDADTPPGTGVTVEVRTGSGPGELGPWLPIAPGASLHLGQRGPTQLQYRVNLTTTDPSVAPVLLEIAFEWSSDPVSPRSSGGRVRP